MWEDLSPFLFRVSGRAALAFVLSREVAAAAPREETGLEKRILIDTRAPGVASLPCQAEPPSLQVPDTCCRCGGGGGGS